MMDTTIRKRKTVEKALNEAIDAWLAGAHPLSRTGTLRDLQPQPWRRGGRRASEQIDRIIYEVPF